MTMLGESSVQRLKRHRFIDEMGDTTFFGKRRRLILGEEGVSLAFGLGLVKISEDLSVVREEVVKLQKSVELDPLLNSIPSVTKRMQNGGFYFHACKDSPDVRSVFLRYLRELNCEAEIVVARKIPALFERKHKQKENEFYADLLSHLIKGRMKSHGTLVFNIAQRGSTTRDRILDQALEIAKKRAVKKHGGKLNTRVAFNVQTPLTEPLLNIADYLCWAVQRVFEKGETRFYDYLRDKIRLVVDLYDFERYAENMNYYDRRKNPLTSKQKISPPST